MIAKLAFRNLIRLPWRTILYFISVFFITVTMTASIFVYGACLDAKRALDENYIFVASLIGRDKSSLSLSDISCCLDDEDVLAFNVTMSEGEGVLPGGETMFRLPSTTDRGEPVAVWLEKFGCHLLAVENLSLTYPFFSGECTIREGTGLTADGYSGERAEIVIPWWLADRYGIAVGDMVVRRYDSRDYSCYIYIPTTVVGIYEAAAHTAEDTSYPAYISLATAELDYGKVFSDVKTSPSSIAIDRADFILKSRDAFEGFVKRAKENGLDFKKADLIYNNSTYDVLSSELDNINQVALLVCGVVLFIGISVLVFFTVYLCNSRKQERVLLRALGMSGHKIRAMFTLELAILIVFSAGLGVGAGRLAAGGMCRFVNDTVLARASASEEIRRLDSAADFDLTMPLERDMKIEISLSDTKISMVDVDVNYIKTPKEDELGISRHTCYAIGTELSFEAEWEPAGVVGLTDIGAVETSISYEQVMALPNYFEDFIYAYVSQDSPYVPDEETGRTILFLTSDGKNSFVKLADQQLSETTAVNSKYVVVIGTYEDNEYCSGDDILIRMEDYHKLYSDFSITDETFYFERIGTIVKKGGDDGDS